MHREDINYLSCAYPFRAFDKNMIISLNYQRLYDFYDKINFDYNYRGFFSDGSFYNVQTETRFRQSGALKAVAPAFAIQITPRLSVGIALNFWTDHLGYNNGWKQQRKTTGSAFIHTMQRTLLRYRLEEFYEEKNENFEGFNVNLGMLWQLNRVVTIGAVLKTPFTADVDRKTYAVSQTVSLGKNPPPAAPYRKKEAIDIKFPMSYGMGIAFRISDELTIDLDVYRTEWSEFFIRDENGTRTNIAGDPWKKSHPHDTTQVRLGSEYLFILEETIVPARFGLFYDPEPAAGHPKDYYGTSVGTGIMLGNVVLDCCYIYRWARDVEAEIPDARKDDAQHTILMSMIIHF
jgi:long-subunit fatty acid transport protein